MTYLETILLYGFHQMQGERTASGLYHLLKGKKSSQTVQDGQLFNLSNLFGTLHMLQINDFTDQMKELNAKGLIEMTESNHPRLTDHGEAVLERNMEQRSLPPEVDGWKYGNISQVFWRRFTLYAQTLSHMIDKDPKFHPIQKDVDVLAWVKRSFPRSETERVQQASNIYNEFLSLLRKLDTQKAENIILRLSRSGKIGKTTLQIADHLHMEKVECHYHFLSALQYVVKEILGNRLSYPILHHFISDMDRPYVLTESSRKTFEFLRIGKSIEEIVRIRKLKETTIEDHIVEIAIHVTDFPIDPYIDRNGQAEITEVSDQLQTKRLKVIKQHMAEKYSYFQIRLTLARTAIKNNRSEKGVLNSVN